MCVSVQACVCADYKSDPDTNKEANVGLRAVY